MTRYNPVSFFYFATCLKLEDSESEVFHGVIETLTNEESDDIALRLGMENLLLCDLSFQVYCFPYIIRRILSHDQDNPEFRELVTEYLKSILSAVPEKIYEPMKSLFKEISSSGHDQLVNRLYGIAALIQKSRQNEQSALGQIAYIDIVQYTAESMLLSLMVYLSENTDIANHLKDEMENEESSPLQEFLNDSSTHKNGRQSFLIAIELQRRLGQLGNPVDFKNLIWRNPVVSRCPDVEPDLTYLFLDAWYFYFKSDTANIVLNLQEELAGLRLYMSCVLDSGNETYYFDQFDQYLLNIYGAKRLSHPKSERCSLSVSIWCSTIFMIAANNLESETGLTFLTRFWKDIPMPVNGIYFDSSGERNAKDSGTSRRTGNNFADSFIAPVLLYAKTESRHLDIEPRYRNLTLYSPWLIYNKTWNADHYPGLKDFSNLLRTLYAVTVSKYMLQRVTSKQAVLFLEYLVHVADQLFYYRDVVLPNNRQKIAKLGENHILNSRRNSIKLILITNREVTRLIGHGNLASIPVERFRELFGRIPSEPVSEEVDFFYQKAFPGVICNWFKTNCKFSTLYSAEDQLRFLSPRITKPKNDYWLRVFRKLFLKERLTMAFKVTTDIETECLYLSSYNNIEDVGKNIKAPSRKEKKDEFLLAIAIETYKLSVLKGKGQEDAAKGLISHLKSIRLGNDISYLNRLGLVSLFDDLSRIDAYDPEVLKISISVILEFGGMFAHQHLARNLLDPLMSGESHYWNQRIEELVQCFAENVVIFLNLAVSETKLKGKPRDPVLEKNVYNAIEVLRNILVTILLISTKYQSRLKEFCISLPVVEEPELEFDMVEEDDVSVRKEWTEYPLSATSSLNGINDIKLIAFHPVTKIIQFYKGKYDIGDVTILFGKTKEEKDKLLSEGKPLKILALFAGEEMRRENTMNVYRFQTDETTIINIPATDTELTLGDLALVYENGGPVPYKKLELSDSRESEVIFLQDLPVDELSRWVPFYADCLSKTLPIRVRNKKPLEVKTLYFYDLFKFVSGIGEQLALVFVGIHWDATRCRYGYLFYRAGSYYILFRENLTCSPEDASGSFEDFILQWSGQSETGFDRADFNEQYKGLIITFTITYNEQKTSLTPVSKSSACDLSLLRQYPGLRFPVDDRNVRWRNLFSDMINEEMIAKKDGRNYFYYTGNEWTDIGFPEKIEVEMRATAMTAREVEFEYSGGWDSWSMLFERRIKGKLVVRQRTIDEDQLQSYLKLDIGSEVKVRSLGAFNKDTASFLCWTPDNYKVNINLEDLTLKPVEQNIDMDDFIDRASFISNIIGWNVLQSGVRIDADEIPEEFIKSGHLTGYFVSVPIAASAEISKPYECKVVLSVNEVKFSRPILINVSRTGNFPLLRCPLLYSKLEARRTKEKNVWEGTIYGRLIYVQPSWKITRKIPDVESIQEDFSLLGVARFEEQTGYLLEDRSAEGKLIFIDRLPALLPVSTILDATGNIDAQWQPVRTKSGARMIFERDNEMISGFKIGRGSGDIANSFLKDIIYNIDQVPGGFVVSRSFRIGFLAIPGIQNKLVMPVTTNDEENEQRLKELEKYFEEPVLEKMYGRLLKEKLEIILNDNSGISKLPSSNGWTNRVTLKTDGISSPEDLVFVPTGVSYYNDQVCFWLQKSPSDNSYFATLKYGEFTLEDYYTEFSNQVKDGVRLFYAGKETFHPYRKEDHAEDMYRFEWGFGWNLLVPQSQILYKGQKIETGRLMFYPGDIIRTINFVRSIENEKEVLKLDILQFDMSQAHRIYNQAEKLNMYHLAHVGYQKDNKKFFIKHVEGANEAGLDSMISVYDRFVAELDKESIQSLESELDNMPDKKDVDIVLLVRLNTKVFEDDYKLQFKRCRLTFIPAPGAGYAGILEMKGDRSPRVIMKLGSIQKFDNDYGISVLPPALSYQKDIGQDFRSGIILRRDFSCDESALRDLGRREKFDRYLDYEVIVTVSKSNKSRQVYFTMKDNPAFRNAKVLLGAAAADLLAVVKEDQRRESDPPILEVTPGNFIDLRYGDCDFIVSGVLKKGDIVDIRVIDKKIALENALAGDSRFLWDRRQVVVLPKESLKNSDNPARRYGNSESLAIGELPNVNLGFGTKSPVQRDQLLQMRHPKIAFVVREAERFYLRIGEDDDSIAGYLQYSPESKRIFYCPLPVEKLTNPDPTPLDWSFISFRNASVDEIAATMRDAKWFYHDQSSFDLAASDGARELRPRFYSLRESSALGSEGTIAGPLFFEILRDGYSLRYKRDLIRWAYPASTLIDFLRLVRWDTTYCVAYAGSSHGIHFVEISPGRIAELPVKLLFLKKGRMQVSLNNYAWDFLQIGDKITLRLFDDRLKEGYKLEVLSIEHGIRSALGKYNYLQVNKIDNHAGFVDLGAGIFTVRLPYIIGKMPLRNGQHVLFDRDANTIRSSINYDSLQENSTGLLALNEAGNIVLQGLYFDFSIEQDIDANELKSIISSLNGALPVTIKQREKRALTCSLMSLASADINLDNKCLTGVIINKLDSNPDICLVRVGGYIEMINLRDIISGFPDAFKPAIRKKLIGQTIWLRYKHDPERGNYFAGAGLSDDDIQFDQIFVTHCHDIAHDSGRLLGIICQSVITNKLYWLPQEEMAWTTVTTQFSKYLFNSPDNLRKGAQALSPAVKVKICKHEQNGAFVSIVQTAEIDSSFRKMKCGIDSIRAEVVSLPSADSNSFIAYSVLDKVLFECINHNPKPPAIGDNISAEVSEKNLQGRKLTATLGVRNQTVYLPILTRSQRVSANQPWVDIATGNDLDPVQVKSTIDELFRSGLSQLSVSVAIRLAEKIAKAEADFFSKLDIVSLIKLIEILNRIPGINQPSASNIRSFISKFVDCIMITALRSIYIEEFNRNIRTARFFRPAFDPRITEYVEKFRNDPFLKLDEPEFNQLRRLAMILTFDKEEQYKHLGKSLLLALGRPVSLDKRYFASSTLARLALLPNIVNYHLKTNGRIEMSVIEQLKEIVKDCIEVNLFAERFSDKKY